jgi:predicted ArsR family transcriptional regulator
VKNTARLGPAPTPLVDEVLATLPSPQRRVLDLLEARGPEATVSLVGEALRLHHNTARGHLDALVELGLVVRSRRPAVGRGRPAWLYTSVVGAGPDDRSDDYLALTTAFATHVAQTSSDPIEASRAIGRDWGQRLAAASSDRAGRAEVLALFARGGFGPELSSDGASVALRRCPLLEAARTHPEVVCQVHQGMVQGILEARGVDSTGVRLLPFAEPGACRLEFPQPVQRPS